MSEFLPIPDSPRDFAINTSRWDGHELTCVSIESNLSTQHNKKIFPPNWKDQVAPHMTEADIVFTNYFIPELKNTVFNTRLYGMGKLARIYAEDQLKVYGDLAEMAVTLDKRVATADLANRVEYVLYESIYPDRTVFRQARGAHSVEPTKIERFLPSAVDARRMYTATGIKQAASELGKAAKILYVAAPAHVNRVSKYVTQPLDRTDRARQHIYQRSFAGLDKTVRTYQHSDRSWKKISEEPVKF